MTIRRPFTTRAAALALLTLAVVAVVGGCAAPESRAIAVTSHVDGQHVFGSRTVTLEGTAANTALVEVAMGDDVVATFAVVLGSFRGVVTLADHRNELRVQTTDGAVGVDLDLVYPWVDATTFRPADVVIGQVDKASRSFGASAAELGDRPYARPLYVGGILYLPDATNNRILGYVGLPTTDGAAADFVLGQASFTATAPNDDDQDGVPDLGPSARTLSCPSGVASDGTRLFVADACNGRVLIFDTLPTTSFAPADVVVGQPSMTAVGWTACGLERPFTYSERLAVGGGRLVVPEYAGNRVLIWNTIPTTNGVEPDLVLGQPGTGATCIENDDDQDGVSGDPSARTFNGPWDAWTDGERLLVSDFSNHRVLLWSTFPTSDFAPADIVIGQDAMNTGVAGSGSTGFDLAYSVASNGNQILVPDFHNARVLVFDAFPTSNGAAADAVLGQDGFDHTVLNDDDQDGASDPTPSARTVGNAYGAWLGDGVMIVNDYFNNRYALFVD